MAAKKRRNTSPPRKSAKKPKRTAGSGVHQIKRFPIQEIHQLMENKFPNGTVKSEAAVYVTAVLEYLATEIIELSINAARDRTSGKSTGVKVSLEDILQAIESDAEIKELIDKVRKYNSSKQQ